MDDHKEDKVEHPKPEVEEEKNMDLEEGEILEDDDDDDGDKDAPAVAAVANSGFKVPDDLAFKRPIFSKVPRNIAHARASAIPAPPSVPDGGWGTARKPDKEKEEEDSTTEEKAADDDPKVFVKSPAQQLIEKSLPLPYKEPVWSGLPRHNYSLEILKTGTIIEVIPLVKPFVVIGRLAQCDVMLEHPSLSRFHCIIQYRAVSSAEEGDEGGLEGFYAYDLGSTHGSYHNKHRMKPHTYYRIRVGHMVKLGGSSRMFILQGPDEDQEPESDLTVMELKAEAAKRAEKLCRLETGEMDEEEDRDRQCQEGEEISEGETDSSREKSQDGIDWGMGEDAEEEVEEDDEDGVNPFATLNEELYLDDPKKTLRGWFEREGYDLPEYVAEDVSPGVYKCKVELPIPGPGGGPLVAIVEQKGRKKAAVIQCALEACRLLDKQGVLRQAKHVSHEKKKKDWAKNDYYESDEDDFLDRTGDVQRKRLRRMKTAAKGGLGGGDDHVRGAETFDSLIKKYKEIIDELSALEEKLAEAERVKRAAEIRAESKDDSADDDDLESFMRNLKSQVPDKHKRVNWKLRAVELRKEELRVRRIANVARLFGTPELPPYISQFASKQNVVSRDFSRKHLDPSRQNNKSESVAIRKKKLIHQAFQEEEPEVKVKLRRLDDASDRPLVPIPYKTNKPRGGGGGGAGAGAGSLSSLSSSSSLSPGGSGGRRSPVVPETEAVNKDDRLSKRETSIDKDNRLREDNLDHSLNASNSRPGLVSSSSSSISSSSSSISSSSLMAEVKEKEEMGHHKDGSKNVDTRNADDDPGCRPHNEKVREGRVLGPTLPPPRHHHLQDEFLKVLRQDDGATKVKKDRLVKKAAAADDADASRYETWVPPANQTGDGRTNLNEKYGY